MKNKESGSTCSCDFHKALGSVFPPVPFFSYEDKDVSPMVKKIQELEKMIETIGKTCSNLTELNRIYNPIMHSISDNNIVHRIEQLEDTNELPISTELVSRVETLDKMSDSFEQKIDHLYDGVEKIFDRIEKIEKLDKKSVPFKCPVCDGSSVIFHISTNTPPTCCISCDKGIIWRKD